MRPTAASFAGSMCMRSFASASSTRTCTTRPNLLQDAEARARREVRRRSREAKPLRPPRPPRSGRHARVDLQRVPREGLRDPRRLHGGLRQARLIAVRHTRGSRRRGVRSIFEGGCPHGRPVTGRGVSRPSTRPSLRVGVTRLETQVDSARSRSVPARPPLPATVHRHPSCRALPSHLDSPPRPPQAPPAASRRCRRARGSKAVRAARP